MTEKPFSQNVDKIGEDVLDYILDSLSSRDIKRVGAACRRLSVKCWKILSKRRRYPRIFSNIKLLHELGLSYDRKELYKAIDGCLYQDASFTTRFWEHGRSHDRLLLEGALAALGKLDVLKWLYSLNIGFLDAAFQQSSEYDFDYVCRHLRQYRCVCDGGWNHFSSLSAAAYGGQIAVAEWLFSIGYMYKDVLYSVACENGKYEFVRWLYNSGYRDRDNGAVVSVIKYSPRDAFDKMAQVVDEQREFLEWLLKIGYTLDDYMLEIAVYEVAGSYMYYNFWKLDWLLSKGCQLSEKLFMALFEVCKSNFRRVKHFPNFGINSYGEEKILLWLFENNCPFSIETFKDALKTYDSALIVILLAKGCPYPTTKKDKTAIIEELKIDFDKLNIDQQRIVLKVCKMVEELN